MSLEQVRDRVSEVSSEHMSEVSSEVSSEELFLCELPMFTRCRQHFVIGQSLVRTVIDAAVSAAAIRWGVDRVRPPHKLFLSVCATDPVIMC